MITRRQSSVRTKTEQLREASFTANNGINIVNPVTDRNSVFNTVNFDVALDGSLTLRKPLILADNYRDSHRVPVYSKHLYLEDYKIQFYTYGRNAPGVKHPEVIQLVYNGNKCNISKGIILDNDGVSHEFDIYEDGFLIKYLNTSEASIINTPTSTIICGAIVDLSYFKNLDLGIFINNVTKVPRYIQLYMNSNNEWILKIMTQMPNEISSDTIRLNPNTTLDYIYSIRDNYDAETVSVTNILAYVHCEEGDNPENLVPGDGVNNAGVITTVEELTENGNVPGYLPVNSISGNEHYVYLKAFLNIKITSQLSYVCVWEKSFDGVTWNTVPEFLEDDTDTITLNVPSELLNESLTESTSFTTKTFKKFIATSQKDLISKRYDILPLRNIDGATYRFSIYTLPETKTIEAVSLAYENVTVDVVYGDSGDVTKTGVLNNSLFEPIFYNVKQNGWEDTLHYFLTFKLFNNVPEDLSTEDFSIKIITFDTEESVVCTIENTGEPNEFALTFNTPSVYNIKTDEVFSTYQFLIKVYYKNEHYFTLKNLVRFQLVDYDEIYSSNESIQITSHSSFENNIESLPQVLNLQEYLKNSNYYSSSVPNTVYRVNYNTQWFKRDHINLSEYVLYAMKSVFPEEVPESIFGYYLVYAAWEQNKLLGNIDTDKLLGIKDMLDAIDSFHNLNAMYISVKMFEHSNLNKYVFTRQRPDWDTVPSSWFEYVVKLKNFEIPTGTLENIVFSYAETFANAFTDVSIYVKNNTHFDTNETQYYFMNTIQNKLIIIPVNTKGDSFTEEYLTSLRKISSDYNINSWETVFTLTSESPDYTPEDSISEIKNFFLLGRSQYSFIKNNLEILYNNEFKSTVLGEKLYYKKMIYSYGHKSFKNNIFSTEVDSFNTPLFNVIDLDASGDSLVTTLIPWRDYLIAATENSMYLISKVDNGYLTKTVNTFIGIPKKDRRTCKSILNGILFKSGVKLYILQPSAYSGDDTILNISEISKPVSNYIVTSEYDNFAFSTEEAYYLFMPVSEEKTICLKYEYTRKIWTKYEYPIMIIDYDILDVNDIRLYTKVGEEYFFNKTLNEVHPNLDIDILDNIPYGDYISLKKEDFEDFISDMDSFRTTKMKPIKYLLDSGQKTDTISYTKQFTESKVILATLHQKDKFPFTLTVKIDGKPQPITIGVHTDSALWKDENTDINTLTTNYADDDSDLFNVLRQMFVRYSAKGKSLQHVILGESYFNFKLYVVYYRYKILNFKQ